MGGDPTYNGSVPGVDIRDFILLISSVSGRTVYDRSIKAKSSESAATPAGHRFGFSRFSRPNGSNQRESIHLGGSLFTRFAKLRHPEIRRRPFSLLTLSSGSLRVFLFFCELNPVVLAFANCLFFVSDSVPFRNSSLKGGRGSSINRSHDIHKKRSGEVQNNMGTTIRDDPPFFCKLASCPRQLS